VAFFFFYRNSRIVADVLFGACNIVEDRGFAAVRIACQGDSYSFVGAE